VLCGRFYPADKGVGLSGATFITTVVSQATAACGPSFMSGATFIIPIPTNIVNKFEE
jgi:hypothetical protein